MSAEPPPSQHIPTLFDMLRKRGRHREDERQRIHRPREQDERTRLSKEYDAIINSPEMDTLLENPIVNSVLISNSPPTIAPESLAPSALGDQGAKMAKRIITIRQRLTELDQVFETVPDDAPYWNHPLCLLCSELENENLCDPKGCSDPLSRNDLDHAAFRLYTKYGLKKDTQIGLDGTILRELSDLQWLKPMLRELDAAGIGEPIYQALMQRRPDVMAECGLVATVNPKSTVTDIGSLGAENDPPADGSLPWRRFMFERQYKRDHPDRSADDKVAAYKKENPKDEHVNKRSFDNARAKYSQFS